MIFGIGTDIIEIDRIKQVIRKYGERFLDRLFTEQERLYCLSKKHPEIHFAGRFAAKEAFAKALGIGLAQGLEWLHMEINNNPNGQPILTCSHQSVDMSSYRCHLSISHCKTYATAVVVIEKIKNPKER